MTLLFLAATLAGAALAHTHSAQRQRPSLAGWRTHAEVVAKDAELRGAPLADAPDASVRLALALASGAPAGAPAHPSGAALVNVSWRTAYADIEGDALTLHCAEDAARTLGDFYLVPAPAGSVLLPLVHNIGCRFEVRYARGFRAHVAAALAPRLGADSDPVGTRLAFGDGAGDVQLTFTSMDSTAPAYVRVGVAAGGPYTLNFTCEAPYTYRAEDLCHAPANTSSILSYLFPGFFHTCVLALQPGTRYYAVYGHVGGAPAPETTFRTRRPPAPETPTRLAAFGDAALYPVFPGTVTTVDMILAQDAEDDLDFVSIIGDLAYAEGSTALWTLWTAFMFPISSQIPLQVTTGNHEVNVNSCFSKSPIAQQGSWPGPTASNTYGDDSGGEGGLATYVRYRAPSNGQGVLWYSFDAGNVHYTMFSSEHSYLPGSPQHAFLAADLLGVDRSKTPWLIVAMHRPMYNSRDDGDWSINVGMAAALEPLFLEAKVDLVMSGHYHNYLRTTSMRNFTVDPTGASPVYITVGTGGATYHEEAYRNDSLSWTAAGYAEWGFGLVETFNSSALRFTFRSNVLGGAVRDEAWIRR